MVSLACSHSSGRAPKLDGNVRRRKHQGFEKGARSQLMVLCNRAAIHDLLPYHGFYSWHCGIRISTVSSAVGATARIAVVVQTGCGFLSGGRRNANLDDKENCYGRAIITLIRAIQYTYILCPVHMVGLIRMVQVIVVGFYTLEQGEIQFHCPANIPLDTTAIFEWDVDALFVPQDRPLRYCHGGFCGSFSSITSIPACPG